MNKSIDQIMKELQSPFIEEELEFRVGATNMDKTMGLALGYVEARAIQNRLDTVVGFLNWKTAYREVQGGFLCSLSLRIDGEWISKEDGAQTTDYEPLKGGLSSAFKRVAASGWGIGRYLYNVRNQWFPIKKKGKGYEFTVTPRINFQDKGTISKGAANVTEGPSQEKLQKARMFKVTFGKYVGRNLGEIYDTDRRYFKYLVDKAQEQKLQDACKYLEKHKAH